MFASRYFNPRYWAERFWAKVGGSAPSPDCFAAFQGEITPESGFQGEIELNLAVSGFINNEAIAVIGTIYPVARFEGIIDPSDTGFNGTITDKDGFTGTICDC